MEKLTAPVPHAAAEDVARRSYGKLVAFLAARTRIWPQPRTHCRRLSLRR